MNGVVCNQQECLNPCRLLGRIVTASLEWILAQMLISGSTAKPDTHQMFLNAEIFSASALHAVPGWPRDWGRVDSLSVRTSQCRDEFLLSATSPLVFHSWENFEVALVEWRCEGCSNLVRNPGTISSDVKQSSKISHISSPKCGLCVCLC